MGKYLKAIKISSQNTFVYSQNYIISTIINIFSTLIVLFLWQAIYLFNKSIEMYSLPSMVLYIFVVQIINNIINTSSISSKVSDDIRSGTLSIYLLRPFSHFLYQFADICGTKLTGLPMIIFMNGLVGTFFLIFSNLIGGIGFSLSITSVVFFLLFVLLSLIWNYIFDYLLGILGFWVDNPWVIFYIKGHIIAILSGLIIPIDLFPMWAKSTMKYLPFQYYVFFPYKVLTGTIPFNEYISNLMFFIAWIGVISLITVAVWRKSIKRFTASGG